MGNKKIWDRVDKNTDDIVELYKKNEEKSLKWVKILPIVSVLISLGALCLTYDSKVKQEALMPLVFSCEMQADITEQVDVTHLETKEKESFDVCPIKINVRSGAIAQLYSISFYENLKKDKMVNVSAEKTFPKRIKSMYKDDIQLVQKESSTLCDKGFYQFYLIVGTDNSNHLIMFWYDKEKPIQGYLTNIRALGNTTNEEDSTPTAIREQYMKLRKYLIEENYDVR